MNPSVTRIRSQPNSVNGASQPRHVTADTGDNPLLKHGILRLAAVLENYEKE